MCQLGAEGLGTPHTLLQVSEKFPTGLMRDVRLIKRLVQGTETLMQLTFVIETSEPCGSTFRLGLGITIPFAPVMMTLQLSGLL